jgi:phosphoribosylformylglycinamidine cyclo-ligase
MSLYEKRGVSAQKEEVHRATAGLDGGLYPHAFCKTYPDYLGGDPGQVNIMHADGAGTKSVLAYLYWKETGDLSVWKNIAQDAIVMNLDDLLCVGVHDHIVFNSTIDRNKRLIPGEVLSAIINGTAAFFKQMGEYGISIRYLGGETADVGDVTRTIAVNGTMTCRWPKNKLITNQHIVPGDVIVGLAGFGQTKYEQAYNSGIGSNGLTSARHDMLDREYATRYPESFDPGMPESVRYMGKYRLTDKLPDNLQQALNSPGLDIGRLLLSPTRTFAPLMKELLGTHFDKIHGLVHCSGGGQTKCLKYLPGNFTIIKDNLFEPPPVFSLIAESSGSSARELYEVFNMGCRMEIYCSNEASGLFIEAAARHGVEARVIGRVEAGNTKKLILRAGHETIHYPAEPLNA